MYTNLYSEIIQFVPEAMREDPDFQRLIHLYCKVLEETFEYSNDVIQTKLVDSLMEKFSKTNDSRYTDFRQDILRVLLNELFYTIDDAENSGVLYNKLEEVYNRVGLSVSGLEIAKMLDRIITEQNIVASKSFNQNKGKYSGFVYINNLIDLAISGVEKTESNYFRLIEGTRDNPKEPFNYRVETSHYKETYEELVKPLVHPLGFGYVVSTMLFILLEDYFGLRLEQTLEYAEIRCLQQDGSYTTTNLLEKYELVSFNEYTKENGTNRFILRVRDPLTNENLRFVGDYDNTLVLYGVDNLKIFDVQLRIPESGIFTPVLGDKGELLSLEYNQYFINRKKQVDFTFRVLGDSTNRVYTSYIPIDPDSLRRVDGQNYIEPITITADMLVEKSIEEVFGYTIEVYPMSCGIHYSIKKEYISTLEEELKLKYDFKAFDYFPRKNRKKNDWYLKRVESFIDSSIIKDNYTDEEAKEILRHLRYPDKGPLQYIGYNLIAEEGDWNLKRTESFIDNSIIKDNYTDEEASEILHHLRYPDKGPLHYIGYNLVPEESGLHLDADYRDYPLPELNFLGKDTNYWLYEQPIYNQKINESIISPDPYRYQDSTNIDYNPCWDIDTHNIVFYPGSSYKGFSLITKDKFVGENYPIGNSSRYTDNEIKEILAGNSYPGKGPIKDIIGYSVSLAPENQDWYLEHRVNFVGEGRIIGNDYSEEEIKKIKAKEMLPLRGDIHYIGDSLRYTLSNDKFAEHYNYQVVSEFTFDAYSSFRETYDYKLEEYLRIETPLYLDDFVYGEEWTVKRNDEVFIGDENAVIGGEYLSDREILDKYLKGEEIKNLGRYVGYKLDVIKEKLKDITEEFSRKVTFYPGSELLDWYYIYSEKLIGSRNVGLDTRYSDDDIREILNHSKYPDKGAITDLVGNYFIDGGWVEKDWYLKKEVSYIGSNEVIGDIISEQDIENMRAHKYYIERPSVRYIGYKLTPTKKDDRLAEYWSEIVDENFVIKDDKVVSDRYDYRVQESSLIKANKSVEDNYDSISESNIISNTKITISREVRDWYNKIEPNYIDSKVTLGDAYTDEEAKLIKENKLGASKGSAKFIDYKYTESTNDWYNSIEPNYIGSGEVIGDTYSDEEIKMIKENRLEVSRGSAKFIGHKYIKKIKKDLGAEYFGLTPREDLIIETKKVTRIDLADTILGINEDSTINSSQTMNIEKFNEVQDQESIRSSYVIEEVANIVDRDEIEFTIKNI